jgi:hypothetical protein
MRLLLIVGMHRSGTSSIAGSLANAGFAFSNNLLEGDRHNKQGYFEDNHLIALHDRMLGRLGSNWMDPHPHGEDWLRRLETAGEIDALRSYLDNFRENPGSAAFVVKDPRICRLLAVWKAAAQADGDELSALCVHRNCVDVAASLWRRNNIPFLHSLQLWARYNLDLVNQIEGIPGVDISFEDFLADPSLLAAALAKLDIPFDDPASLTRFANPELRTRVEDSKKLSATFKSLEHPLLSSHAVASREALVELYEICGGDNLALERRHYGVIHSTLWTVLEEKRGLESKLHRIRDAMG